MSFGTESSTPVGGQTLTGFIVSKATQSRKEAKKQDRKEKKKESKSKSSDSKSDQKPSVAKKLLGSVPTLGNLFSSKKPETKSQPQTRTRSSGNGTGLAKILTSGFGSLTADTLGIASGLASVTQLLNNSLKAQTFTATGVQTITSILSDQVENQSSILSTVKSLKRGGESRSGKSMFGSSKSGKVGGGTLTEALINAAIERGIGRFIASRLSRLNPFGKKPPTNTPKTKPPTGGSNNPRGSYYDDAVATSKRNAQNLRRQGFMNKLKDIGEGFKGKAASATEWGKGIAGKGIEAGKGLLGKAKGAGDNIIKGATGPIGKRLGSAFAKFSGRMIPVAGTGFSAAEAADRAKKGDKFGAWLAGLGGAAGGTATVTAGAAATGVGAAVPAVAEATSMVADIGLLGYDLINAFNPSSKLSGGGVMLGEAGREAVVDLNSNQGKNLMGQQNGDPGMKASAASTLAVVDQFIKGMGPLGSPVAQALGPDIQNLVRSFGMSQYLPNLRIGGGKFKEDGNAKKTRDDFMEELISGSLKALDAKKKSSATGTPPPAATGPGTTGTEEQQKAEDQRAREQMQSISPGGIKMTTMTSDGEQVQVMESVDKIAGTKIGTTSPNIFGKEQDVIGPGPDYRPVEGTNGERWYNSDGRLFAWKPGGTIRALTQQELKAGWNGRTFLRKPDTGHVRAHQGSLDILNLKPGTTPAIGEYSYTEGKVLVPQKGDPKKGTWQSVDEEKGRFGGRAPSLPPATDIKLQSGGTVQKPWWDFLGLVTGMQEVQKGTTGIYSDSPTGRIGEAAAQRNKLLKQYGYERGGSLLRSGMFNSSDNQLERRVKALEDIIAVTAFNSVPESNKQTPIASSAMMPVSASSEPASDMGSAAIFNIIGGMSGGGGSIPASSESPQTSSDYISDPWPNGLAGVLCSSPWSSV